MSLGLLTSGGATYSDEIKTGVEEGTTVSDLVASVALDDEQPEGDGEDEEEEEAVEVDDNDTSDDGNNSVRSYVRDDGNVASDPSDGHDRGDSATEEVEKREEETAEPRAQPFEVTAYTAMCDSGCTGVTAAGIDVNETIYYEGKRIVATDPSVIPTGSDVIITLSNGEQIEATAQDTGGNIVGNRIDLLVGSEEEAEQFGRKTLEVEIIH